jgi:hypothetical protein
MSQCRARGRPDRSRRAPGRERGADERVLTAGVPGVGGARGRERAGPTRSHPEPGRDPAQRRRVLWGRPHGRRGRRGHPPPSVRRRASGHLAGLPDGPMVRPARWSGRPDTEGSEPPAPSPHPTRGGAAAARWAHNPKVGGSNPPPATTFTTPAPPSGAGVAVSFGTLSCPNSTRAVGWILPLPGESSTLSAMLPNLL